jgi:hypothetical protein
VCFGGISLVYFAHVLNYITELPLEVPLDLLPDKMLMNPDNGSGGGMDLSGNTAGSSNTSDVNPKQDQVADEQPNKDAVADKLMTKLEQDKLADARTDYLYHTADQDLIREQAILAARQSALAAQHATLVEAQAAVSLDQELSVRPQSTLAGEQEAIVANHRTLAAQQEEITRSQRMLDFSRQRLADQHRANLAARFLRDEERDKVHRELFGDSDEFESDNET